MMQAKKAELTRYSCGFAFLFGGLSGCLTGYLCSENAQYQLSIYFLSWNFSDVSDAYFAAELLIAVFALILSLVIFGHIFIPVLDLLIGFIVGITLFITAKYLNMLSWEWYQSFAFLPDALIMIRLTQLSSEISKRNTKTWTSMGLRIFDVEYSLHRIWIYLFLFWILHIIRYFLF